MSLISYVEVCFSDQSCLLENVWALALDWFAPILDMGKDQKPVYK